MLAFRIVYLRGVVTAADVAAGQEKDSVEWPPHPDRFFCALTQAWADLGATETAARALRELEKAGPPLIQCGELLPADIRARYVPVNDRFQPFSGEKPAQLIQGTSLGRDRKERKFPQAPLSHPEVIFYWPDFTLSEQLFQECRRLARQVSHLGHSSSLVSVDLLTEDGNLQPNWLPSPEGLTPLRVPFPGRFEELCVAFKKRKDFTSWPPLALSVNYMRSSNVSQPSAGAHHEAIFFRLLRDGLPLPLETTIRLLSVWRKALLAIAPQPIPELISGHAADSTPDRPVPSDRPHLALIPAPDVGHDFAAGHLIGVAAVLPRDIDPLSRQICLSVLFQVQKINLGNLGQVQLIPVDAFERRRALLPQTWAATSSRWASVTPVVLGKYPRHLFSEESCRIVEEACTIAGLPRPVSIHVGPMPWIVGSLPAARFPAFPSRPGKPKRAHLHVRLEFAQPITGPVLVGAGRHLGYGLFRPCEEVNQ